MSRQIGENPFYSQTSYKDLPLIKNKFTWFVWFKYVWVILFLLITNRIMVKMNIFKQN